MDPAVLQDLLNQQQQQIAELNRQLTALRQAQPAPVVAPVTPMARPKVNKPQNFYGERDADKVEEWILQMQQYHARFPGLSEADKVYDAASYLKESALVWWTSKLQEIQAGTGDPIPDVAAFYAELKQQFEMPNKQQALRDQWYGLKQRGSLLSLISRMRSLALKLRNLTEDEKIDKLLRVVETPVAEQVRIQQPRTFDSAARIALEVDQARRSVGGSRGGGGASGGQQQRGNRGLTGGGNASGNARSGQSPSPMELGNMQQRSTGQPNRQFPSGGQGNQQGQRRCFICNRVGHLARFCPNRAQQNNNVEHEETNVEELEEDEVSPNDQ